MTTPAASVPDGTGNRDATADDRDAARRAREVHERQRSYVLASLLAVPDADDEQRPAL